MCKKNKREVEEGGAWLNLSCACDVQYVAKNLLQEPHEVFATFHPITPLLLRMFACRLSQSS